MVVLDIMSEKNHLEKSTPLHTKDWYITWVASIILLAGMILTAQNLYVNVTGLIGWLAVAIMWNDRALIIINAVGVSIYANGIVALMMK